MSTDIMREAAALAAALEAENAALRALDVRRAVALFPQKAALAARLQAAVTRAAAGAAAGEAAPDSVAPTSASTLEALAEENRRLLERAMAVQAKLIATLARAAPPPGLGYGSLGYGGLSYGGQGYALGYGRPARAAHAVAVRPMTLSARA